MRIPRLLPHLISCVVALAAVLGCSHSGQGAIPEFDGQRAYQLLVKQVGFGPRYSGAPGHNECAQFIQQTLELYADGVAAQDFTARANRKSLAMTNVTAWFNPGAKRWVLLAAHWDSRPTADCEVTAAKRAKPIPGANDGASGVAVLLELARMFREKRPEVGVFMVFFDGEDYGPKEDAMYLGSKHFAGDLAKNAVVDGKPVKFDYGIVVDMVGDKNLGIYRESNSVEHAPEIVDKVWATARRLGYEKAFQDRERYSVNDDHLPLIRAGVKCIDVIDLDYGPWHTLDDTPDKCSAASLETAGRVIARVVYDERTRD